MFVSGRAGRNAWVGVGPVGLLILSPIFAIYYLCVWPIVAPIRAIVRHQRKVRAAQEYERLRREYLDAVAHGSHTMVYR